MLVTCKTKKTMHACRVTVDVAYRDALRYSKRGVQGGTALQGSGITLQRALCASVASASDPISTSKPTGNLMTTLTQTRPWRDKTPHKNQRQGIGGTDHVAHLSLNVLAVLHVTLASRLVKSTSAVGTRNQARIWHRRLRRGQVREALAGLLSTGHNPCLVDVASSASA